MFFLQNIIFNVLRLVIKDGVATPCMKSCFYMPNISRHYNATTLVHQRQHSVSTYATNVAETMARVARSFCVVAAVAASVDRCAGFVAVPSGAVALRNNARLSALSARSSQLIRPCSNNRMAAPKRAVHYNSRRRQSSLSVRHYILFGRDGKRDRQRQKYRRESVQR